MARAAGFVSVFQVDDPASWREDAGRVLSAPGPAFVCARVHPENDGPISRGPGADAPYLEPSLADASAALRKALARSEKAVSQPRL
jgi:hypothetical protein